MFEYLHAYLYALYLYIKIKVQQLFHEVFHEESQYTFEGYYITYEDIGNKSTSHYFEMVIDKYIFNIYF